VPFTIRQGDRLPVFEVVLRDRNGPVDLTSSTVKLHMVDALRRNVVLNVGAAPAVDQSGEDKGRVFYEWGAGDTLAPRELDVEFEVTFLSGKVQTFPNEGYVRVRVTPQLA
jgi:hypothetical protein